MGWLITTGALLLIGLILAGMIWRQWCHTSDWQDRYW
jgi:hypothetical protein